MHPVTESADADPVIVSLSGSVFLSAPVVTAFQSGELEPEGAFARFYGTCHALGPHWFTTKQLEAHEAFWCFGDVVRSGRFSGDLAWFQTGVYDLSTALVSVPLLVHASGVAVEQLGPCSSRACASKCQLPDVASTRKRSCSLSTSSPRWPTWIRRPLRYVLNS